MGELIDPNKASRRTTARKIAHMHDDLQQDELIDAIVKELEQEYIKGGIGATEALLDSVPSSALELPDGPRKMLGVLTGVVQQFQDKLKAHLK